MIGVYKSESLKPVIDAGHMPFYQIIRKLGLGFAIAERTVSRWIQRESKNPDPARRWLVFLRNHRDAIAAMDFRVEGTSVNCRRSLALSAVSSFVRV